MSDAVRPDRDDQRTSPQLIADLVRSEYDAETIALDPVGNDPTGERATFRAELDDGRIAMLRGYPAGSRVPFWHGGGLVEEWLRERAFVLAWLERQGYLAPRVIPARTGEMVATHAGYHVLAVTYIPGRPLSVEAQSVGQLASELGRLHALGQVQDWENDLPNSWWHPLDETVSAILARLEGARGWVPARWQPLHHSFAAALGAFRGRNDLPVAAIHGDCYPGNAIELADGQVALNDWECAGSGTAVLDLGDILLDALPDPVDGEPVVVNPGLVAAMVSGYRRVREPTTDEREHLLEAIRFGVAFVGSLRFIWASEQGWSERIERSLLRLEARYVAAKEVAYLARNAFERQ